MGVVLGGVLTRLTPPRIRRHKKACIPGSCHVVYRLFPVSVHTRNFTECGIAYIAK